MEILSPAIALSHKKNFAKRMSHRGKTSVQSLVTNLKTCCPAPTRTGTEGTKNLSANHYTTGQAYALVKERCKSSLFPQIDKILTPFLNGMEGRSKNLVTVTGI